jgi:endonuclease/exonuclease/phosphatase family metal-dependent hydrolase
MPIFPKPKFPFEYDVNHEIMGLRTHKVNRGIPDPTPDTILAATWNLANLGAQIRRDQDRSLIAEIISWFDIVAIQECRENFSDLFDIQYKLGPDYKVVMSDASGNNERQSFIYNSTKLSLLEEIGEISFPPSNNKYIKLPGIELQFDGFDRTPFLVSFVAGKTSFVFINVHLFYGDDKPESIDRRALETFAVARWANLRQKNPFSFTRELVVMGDFNMPKSEPGDPIYNALTKLGLELPQHSTQIASSIANQSNYDQVAFLPGTTKDCFTGKKGVFDYDAVIFPSLWMNGTNASKFKAYLRYYITDHRPMWVQLKLETD